MTQVKPKKSLGQHFLNDLNIAKKIVEGLNAEGFDKVVEIGPGMGVLTNFLLQNKNYQTHVIEIDTESVDYLKVNFPDLKNRILNKNVLKIDFDLEFGEKIGLIGNLPYNISSQIFFKVLEYRNLIPECVFMIQKEVAERIAAPPGNKTYGILSVLLQAYYDIKYLFTVHENVFVPNPKVKSGVIRLVRNNVEKLDCNEVLFQRVVKTGFNQRRKTLRNSLKPLLAGNTFNSDFLNKRPEQLSVQEFIELTNQVESALN